MVRVNKKYLKEELRNAAWRHFLEVIKSSKSEKTLVEDLHKFLTDTEIIMIEKRLAIPILLERGLSYAAIGKTIDVSPGTISFVKRDLTKKPVVHKKLISVNKPESGNESFGPLMSPAEHMRRMRRKMSGY
jgi:uncharacterized protein YerC